MKTGKLLQAKKIIPREKGLKKSHEKTVRISVSRTTKIWGRSSKKLALGWLH